MKYTRTSDDETASVTEVDSAAADVPTSWKRPTSPILRSLRAQADRKAPLTLEINDELLNGNFQSFGHQRLGIKLSDYPRQTRLLAGATGRVRFRCHDDAKCEFLTSLINATRSGQLLVSQPVMIQRIDERSGVRQVFSTVDFILFRMTFNKKVHICSVIDVSPKGFALMLSNDLPGLRVGQKLTGQMQILKTVHRDITVRVRHISPEPSVPSFSRIGCSLLPGATLDQSALHALIQNQRGG